MDSKFITPPPTQSLHPFLSYITENNAPNKFPGLFIRKPLLLTLYNTYNEVCLFYKHLHSSYTNYNQNSKAKVKLDDLNMDTHKLLLNLPILILIK